MQLKVMGMMVASLLINLHLMVPRMKTHKQNDCHTIISKFYNQAGGITLPSND